MESSYKLRINHNILILCIFIFVALLFNFLSKGDYSGIGSDFAFYFNRLVFIKEFNIPFSEWFSNNLSYPFDSSVTRVSNWVPTPFYTLIFLGPLFLHNSNFLFAIQGIIIAFLTFRIVKRFLTEIYYSFNNHTINLITLIGSLNPAFLKDALTSGPISVCNLFILYGFVNHKRILISSLLFCCAAMTRSSYPIYWITILLACIIGRRAFLKIFLKITFLSLIVYIIFYKYFYITYPGSIFSDTFTFGLGGMDYFDNFFINILSKYYEVSDKYQLQNLDISIIEYFKLITSDIELAYGAFAAWIFKILSSLGFRHMTLLWDMRSIWIQRFVTIIYFIFVMAPAFCVSTISLLTIPRANFNFWINKERSILIFALSFILIHSILWGQPRYATATSWIFVAFFVKFLKWLRYVVIRKNINVAEN